MSKQVKCWAFANQKDNPYPAYAVWSEYENAKPHSEFVYRTYSEIPSWIFNQNTEFSINWIEQHRASATPIAKS